MFCFSLTQSKIQVCYRKFSRQQYELKTLETTHNYTITTIVNILVHLITNVSSVHITLYAHFKNINPTVIYKISFYVRSHIEFILVSLNILLHHSLPWLHGYLFSKIPIVEHLVCFQSFQESKHA